MENSKFCLIFFCSTDSILSRLPVVEITKRYIYHFSLSGQQVVCHTVPDYFWQIKTNEYIVSIDFL